MTDLLVSNYNLYKHSSFSTFRETMEKKCIQPLPLVSVCLSDKSLMYCQAGYIQFAVCINGSLRIMGKYLGAVKENGGCELADMIWRAQLSGGSRHSD